MRKKKIKIVTWLGSRVMDARGIILQKRKAASQRSSGKGIKRVFSQIYPHRYRKKSLLSGNGRSEAFCGIKCMKDPSEEMFRGGPPMTRRRDTEEQVSSDNHLIETEG
ncbi:hypothetical protein TNCV_3051371 [Trichonephila clavipes]|nr:hypothetical protein TNCV_3051371 [Trichonephila clavipes]